MPIEHLRPVFVIELNFLAFTGILGCEGQFVRNFSSLGLFFPGLPFLLSLGRPGFFPLKRSALFFPFCRTPVSLPSSLPNFNVGHFGLTIS